MDVKVILKTLSECALEEPARVIAKKYHITLLGMFDRSRTRPAPQARAEFYIYLYKLGWSYPRIGKFFGYDHTTISNQVKAHARELENKEVERVL